MRGCAAFLVVSASSLLMSAFPVLKATWLPLSFFSNLQLLSFCSKGRTSGEIVWCQFRNLHGSPPWQSWTSSSPSATCGAVYQVFHHYWITNTEANKAEREEIKHLPSLCWAIQPNSWYSIFPAASYPPSHGRVWHSIPSILRHAGVLFTGFWSYFWLFWIITWILLYTTDPRVTRACYNYERLMRYFINLCTFDYSKISYLCYFKEEGGGKKVSVKGSKILRCY